MGLWSGKSKEPPMEYPAPWRWEGTDPRESTGLTAANGLPVLEYGECGSHAIVVAPECRKLLELAPRLLAAARFACTIQGFGVAGIIELRKVLHELKGK